jgi:hypothetical protein
MIESTLNKEISTLEESVSKLRKSFDKIRSVDGEANVAVEISTMLLSSIQAFSTSLSIGYHCSSVILCISEGKDQIVKLQQLKDTIDESNRKLYINSLEFVLENEQRIKKSVFGEKSF